MNKKCQVFTPANSVIKLLDLINYKSNICGKKIIENACGDGNILQEVVRRYISDCLNHDMPLKEIKLGLERDIYGAEIDKEQYCKCIANLDSISCSFGIEDVRWNVLNEDILKKSFLETFDFVVGNPPYISYGELDAETRKYLKENFDSCKHGKFDYCYAFIEHSIATLKPNGLLAYLIPSSIFKNVFAKALRDLILPNLLKIVDYTTLKLFENALTSSAILVCQKNSNALQIQYENVVQTTSKAIAKDSLKEKWIFSSNCGKNKTKKRFGDYFHASISVATLYNKAFVLNCDSVTQDHFVSGNNRIEKEIVRPAASPRSLNYGKNHYIIFPYWYNEKNILIKYSESEFQERFPEGVRYLNMYEAELAARNSDKSAKWFEYGRSQALAHLNCDKLLLSTVITGEVKVYTLDKLCIPYSGIYIIPLRGSKLSEASEILQSKQFLEYVKNIGINANGVSLRITAVDINNYMF